MVRRSKSEDKRYTLTNEFIETDRGKLYRIMALKNFEAQGRRVYQGELGGFIASEDNLLQQENSWVFDNAKMYDNSRLWGNACIFNESSMYDNSHATDNSAMFDKSSMHDHSWLQDNSRMNDNSELYDDSKMGGDGQIFNDVVLRNKVLLTEDAYVKYNSDILSLDIPYINVAFYKDKCNDFKICCNEKAIGSTRFEVYSLSDFERNFNCRIHINEEGLLWESNDRDMNIEMPYLSVAFFAGANKDLNIRFQKHDLKGASFGTETFSAHEFEIKFNCSIQVTEKGFICKKKG